MSVEFEPIHVRPMTETPTVNFRYVANSGIISCLYYATTFNPEMYEQVGWIPARATSKPQPKEGEWWMCNLRHSNIDIPLKFRDGKYELSEYLTVSPNNATPLYKMERTEG